MTVTEARNAGRIDDEVALVAAARGGNTSCFETLVRRRTMRRGGPQPQHVTNVAAETIEHELLTFGDVRIDFTSMEAARAGNRMTLTALEFKLLKFFARSPARVISREELLNEVWGYENYPTTRTVDNYILHLRQKLEPDRANPRYFLTMYGAGYKFTTGNVATAVARQNDSRSADGANRRQRTSR